MPDAARNRLVTLKNKLSDLQQALLDHFWTEFDRRGTWPSTKAVHQHFGKPAVSSALRELGGSVVFEAVETPGKARYHLSLLGVLLTSEGQAAEALLIRYLEYLRKRVEE